MKFDAAALSKLQSLQLRVQSVVEGTMAGLHRSPHRGGSIEFAEHKEYSPGDDTRQIDWKAFAKFDRYFIRQFENETELKAFFLVDVSASMGYGAPLSKYDYAAVLTASLGHLLLGQRDQVGLLLFNDHVCDYLPPRGRQTQLTELMQLLDRQRPNGKTDLVQATKFIMEQRLRRSVVFIVSDLFNDRDGFAEESEKSPSNLSRIIGGLRAQKHAVVVLQLLHPDETTFSFENVTRFVSMEDEKEYLTDPAAARSAYLSAFEAFVADVQATCRNHQVLYQQVVTSDPVDLVLFRLIQAHKNQRTDRLS